MKTPLHIKGEGYTPAEAAAVVKLIQQHFRISGGRGWRQEPGTGSKRIRPHNARSDGKIRNSPTYERLLGLALIAHHGAHTALAEV